MSPITIKNNLAWVYYIVLRFGHRRNPYQTGQVWYPFSLPRDYVSFKPHVISFTIKLLTYRAIVPAKKLLGGYYSSPYSALPPGSGLST